LSFKPLFYLFFISFPFFCSFLKQDNVQVKKEVGEEQDDDDDDDDDRNGAQDGDDDDNDDDDDDEEEDVSMKI
jgi:hypothetical protein